MIKEYALFMKVKISKDIVKIIKGTRIWRTIIVLCWLVFGPVSWLILSLGSDNGLAGFLAFLVISLLFLLIFAYLKPFVITVDKLKETIQFSANYSFFKKSKKLSIKISEVKELLIKETYIEDSPHNVIDINLSYKAKKVLYIFLAITLGIVTLGLLFVIVLGISNQNADEFLTPALMFFVMLLFLDYQIIRAAIDPRYADTHTILNKNEGYLASATTAQQSTFYNVIIILNDNTQINVSELPGIGTSIHIKRDMLKIASTIAEFINVSYKFEAFDKSSAQLV